VDAASGGNPRIAATSGERGRDQLALRLCNSLQRA
jgi:hypothetical protein